MEHQNITKFLSLKMKETPKYYYEIEYSDYPNIVVRFNFKHYREIHHFCDDEVSPLPQDHTILSKVLDDESSFGFELVIPLEPATVEFYFACTELGENWPDFVCPEVWKVVKEKVSNYVLMYADFDGKLGFEMVANVGVSTLDIPCC